LGERRATLIAIDGPAASGKSTVALRLARRTGFALIDSGSMYRAVALLTVEEGVSFEDEAKLGRLARKVHTDFRADMSAEGNVRVFLGERDVTDDIRSVETTRTVSPVSRFVSVRSEMVNLQRELASERDSVVEGRDIGTVVFPDATLKVYLDATEVERASRRYREYMEKGVDINMEAVNRQIRSRDSCDSGRDLSPLARADDAVFIDTTTLTLEEVVDEILKRIEPRQEGCG
jgi:CMP/dCMP kinase